MARLIGCEEMGNLLAECGRIGDFHRKAFREELAKAATAKAANRRKLGVSGVKLLLQVRAGKDDSTFAASRASAPLDAIHSWIAGCQMLEGTFQRLDPQHILDRLQLVRQLSNLELEAVASTDELKDAVLMG